MRHRTYSFAGSLRHDLHQRDLRELTQQLTDGSAPYATKNGPLRAMLYVCFVSRCAALILGVEDYDAGQKWKRFFEESLGTGGAWKHIGKRAGHHRNVALSPGLALRFNEQIIIDATLTTMLPSSFLLRNRLETDGEVQGDDEGSGIAPWSRLTVCLKLTGETPHARWTSWQRTVSVVQDQIDSISGVAAFCLRERTVWLIVEARQEDVERRVEAIKAHGHEVRCLRLEKGLSPDAHRFGPDESVELQLLSSERLLRVQLSITQLRDIAEQQSVVPYLPACTLS